MNCTSQFVFFYVVYYFVGNRPNWFFRTVHFKSSCCWIFPEWHINQRDHSNTYYTYRSNSRMWEMFLSLSWTFECIFFFVSLSGIWYFVWYLHLDGWAFLVHYDLSSFELYGSEFLHLRDSSVCSEQKSPLIQFWSARIRTCGRLYTDIPYICVIMTHLSLGRLSFCHFGPLIALTPSRQLNCLWKWATSICQQL